MIVHPHAAATHLGPYALPPRARAVVAQPIVPVRVRPPAPAARSTNTRIAQRCFLWALILESTKHISQLMQTTPTNGVSLTLVSGSQMMYPYLKDWTVSRMLDTSLHIIAFEMPRMELMQQAGKAGRAGSTLDLLPQLAAQHPAQPRKKSLRYSARVSLTNLACAQASGKLASPQ